MIDDAWLLPGVSPRHRIDVTRLGPWLHDTLPGGFDGELVVRQFRGGQSNPTYCLETNVGAFVLRKKPAGVLLASAHAIDREYRVMQALADTAVPVPPLLGYCADDSLLGTPFYLMGHVPGRMLGERTVPPGQAIDGRGLYLDMVTILARLHALDWRGLGLADFGRPDGYLQRQVKRWARQLEASLTQEWPAVQHLCEWLPARLPTTELAALVHGDYRLGNMLVDPARSKVCAVLDWELATIGHPLADLGYYCISYELPAEFGGCSDLDLQAHRIPAQQEVLAHYAAHFTPASGYADLRIFVVFAMFRLAAIGAGVYRRALDGNAADDNARSNWRRYRHIGETAWRLARQIDWGDAPARST